MADIVDRQTRSRMMAGIRGKDTKPELAIRRALHARGLRFRLHAKGMAGRPDLVLRKHRAVIFVHGCYWHRHEGCPFATTPASRPEFWSEKFLANVRRDLAVRGTLAGEGWRVAIVWECALRQAPMVAKVAALVETWLVSDSCSLEVPERVRDEIMLA